jgi:hypothetical protein
LAQVHKFDSQLFLVRQSGTDVNGRIGNASGTVILLDASQVEDPIPLDFGALLFKPWHADWLRMSKRSKMRRVQQANEVELVCLLHQMCRFDKVYVDEQLSGKIVRVFLI